MKPFVKIFLFSCLFLTMLKIPVSASHLLGAESSYKYLGDTVVFGVHLNKYLINLIIYEDCVNGSPDAIAFDNPAYIGIFDRFNSVLVQDTVQSYSVEILNSTYDSVCITAPPTVCVLKRRFSKMYLIKQETTPIYIVYQRCCFIGAYANIFDPSNTGLTLPLYLNPIAMTDSNSSPVFHDYENRLLCVNQPFTYDHSAIDPDGDSLTFFFAHGFGYMPPPSSGASVEYPLPQPYSVLSFVSPWSYSEPLGSAVHIDPASGIISGVPNEVGNYLVTVACASKRGSIGLDTIYRTTRFIVANPTVPPIESVSLVPNPSFNSFTLSYHLNKVVDVSMVLYDCLGRKYNETASADLQALGNHSVVITPILPGIYFLKAQIGDRVYTYKLVRL